MRLQCTFMSLSALLHYRWLCPVWQRITNTADEILMIGDVMYLKAFEQQMLRHCRLLMCQIEFVGQLLDEINRPLRQTNQTKCVLKQKQITNHL